jgi:hypothetical protein
MLRVLLTMRSQLCWDQIDQSQTLLTAEVKTYTYATASCSTTCSMHSPIADTHSIIRYCIPGANSALIHYVGLMTDSEMPSRDRP